jgi:hypothetical protein
MFSACNSLIAIGGILLLTLLLHLQSILPCVSKCILFTHQVSVNASRLLLPTHSTYLTQLLDNVSEFWFTMESYHPIIAVGMQYSHYSHHSQLANNPQHTCAHHLRVAMSLIL